MRKHVHTNQQDRLGFYPVYVLDRWAFLNALDFPSPHFLQLRCSANYSFLSVLNHAYSPEKEDNKQFKISCPALLPRPENSLYFL